MATLNASKWGYITTGNQSTFSAARNATTGTATVNPTTSAFTAIEYTKLPGRSRGTYIYRISRTFYYFNTSAITGTVSSATINILGNTSTNADVIVVPSTAFGGIGTSNLVGADINNITYNTTYGSEYTAWSNSNNSITLASQALSDIQNNNYFICAVIEYDHDFQNYDELATNQYDSGINFATTAYLDYTLAATSDITSLNTITRTNIAYFNTIALANIDKINTIEN